MLYICYIALEWKVLVFMELIKVNKVKSEGVDLVAKMDDNCAPGVPAGLLFLLLVAVAFSVQGKGSEVGTDDGDKLFANMVHSMRSGLMMWL